MNVKNDEYAMEQLRHAIVNAKVQGLVLALKSMKKEDVFPYFLELAKNTGASDLVSIAETAVNCNADRELREQLKPMVLIEATITAASEEADKPSRFRLDHVIRGLIVMSAMLFNNCCDARSWHGDSSLVVAERGLRLYNWMFTKHPPEKELAEVLLDNCGAIIDQEDIKVLKANLKNLVGDEAKLSMAYEAISGGYLKHNSLLHLASEALWKDEILSQVTSLTPNYDILETLKRALTNVDVKKPETLKTAKLLYDQYTGYFGSGDAMKAVIFVRPDLAGEF